MREITQEMIKTFKIDKLGFDFMGYTFKRKGDLSFHHLIIPRRESKQYGIGEGYLFWNGAILKQNTSHEYLHIIEQYDKDMFNAITSEMIDENFLRRIEISNLKHIRDILLQFEKEYCGGYSKKGKPIIREEYITNRINLEKVR